MKIFGFEIKKLPRCGKTHEYRLTSDQLFKILDDGIVTFCSGYAAEYCEIKLNGTRVRDITIRDWLENRKEYNK